MTDVSAVTTTNSLIQLNCPCGGTKSHTDASQGNEIRFKCSEPITGRFVSAQKIIQDNAEGWSVNEFAVFYEGKKIGPLSLSYFEFERACRKKLFMSVKSWAKIIYVHTISKVTLAQHPEAETIRLCCGFNRSVPMFSKCSTILTQWLFVENF